MKYGIVNDNLIIDIEDHQSFIDVDYLPPALMSGGWIMDYWPFNDGVIVEVVDEFSNTIEIESRDLEPYLDDEDIFVIGAWFITAVFDFIKPELKTVASAA